MCGISFLYERSNHIEVIVEKIDTSLSVMQHRGPDGRGIWSDNNVAMGHRRLSIIDLYGSQQPMLDLSGRFVLSYNGEIYNYRELRSRLETHWSFQTEGDTEVLLAGLVLHGESFLEVMEGMWAFVFWDNKKKELFLCRDRMGKKPLYYQETKTRFSCASELPALATLSSYHWGEDPDSSADYFRYGYYLPGTTAYREVREVLPGSFLKWRPKSRSYQKRYWNFSLEPFSGTRLEAQKQLRYRLIKAVEKRMVADVEVGAFLSGGVDSSLIVSILSNELGEQVKTFTIGFAERSFDESGYAEQIARLYETTHCVEKQKNLTHREIEKLILHHVGQPFADPSLLPTALVCKIAASHVKVALSGDGGDELFSGYQRYQAQAILRWYTRLPDLIKNTIGKSIRALPEPVSHHSQSLLKKAHLFQDIVDRIAWQTPYIAPVLYSQAEYEELFPDLIGLGHSAPNMPDECKVDDIQRMMTADALVYLPQDILLKVDRASMAHSLESRAPFLDHQVVELAFSMPRYWHRNGAKGKLMLQDSFKDSLPMSIWHRRKQGFSVPLHNWFHENLLDRVGQLLRDVNTPISLSAVEKMMGQFKRNERDHSLRLWSIYTYLLWKQSWEKKNQQKI